MNAIACDEALLAYDQQFELQVGMVMNGMLPHGGTSLDFIVRILKRKGYEPERVEVMEKLVPLVKEEIRYLELKETLHPLEARRDARLARITALSI